MTRGIDHEGYEDQCDNCNQRKIILFPYITYGVTGDMIGEGKMCLECIRHSTKYDSNPTKAWRKK